MSIESRLEIGASPTALLSARGLEKTFLVGSRSVQAVRGVDLDLAPGETLALVGESGSGKSTVARMIVRLLPATAGRVIFEGRDLLRLPPREVRRVRRRLQMVFQDPAGSLDPRMNVAAIVSEPLRIHGNAVRGPMDDRVAALLASVGLPAETMRRYPHELSGGQRQRVGIARALAVEPRVILADEPVSALDVSVRAQIVNLLRQLQSELGLAYLFIAHDLALVKQMSHRVAVMYRGRIAETAPAAELFADPLHPYTRRLLAAVPAIHGAAGRRSARVPHPEEDLGPLIEASPGHWVARARPEGASLTE